LEENLPSKLNQDRLHCVIATPVSKTRELGRIDLCIISAYYLTTDFVKTHLAVPRIDTWQIDLAYKLDGWWLVGILITAVHLEGVDSVLVNALGGSKSVYVYERRGGFHIRVGDQE